MSKIYAVEHKTTSKDIAHGSPYWQRLTLDAQISNYLVGTRSLGYEPAGMMYDVLRKPGLEPRMATPPEDRKYTKPTKAEPVSRLYAGQRDRDETPGEYHDRIASDIAERPDYYYQRGIVVRLEEEERDAAFDVWQVGEAIRLSKNSERWPRNVDACEQYGRFCDYWRVCSGETTIDDPLWYAKGEAHPELGPRDVTRLPVLTSSSARSFRSCPKRYQLGYELAMRLRKASEPLRIGTIVHAGIEAWLLSGRDLAAMMRAASAHFEESDPYEQAKIEAMLRGYHVRWLDEPFDVLAVEQEFSCPLVNPETGKPSRTWQRAGKIDAIVRLAA